MRRLSRLRKMSGLIGLGSRALYNSGRIDFIRKLMEEEPGLSMEGVIRKRRAEIEERYGVIPSIPRFLLMYGDYLKEERPAEKQRFKEREDCHVFRQNQ